MKTVAAHLADLVRIPSPSAVSNRPLIEFASAALRQAAWTVRELSCTDPAGTEKVNLIAAPPGQDVAARDVDLVLMCHTDTVPYAADWADALNPIVVDGQLHGCGSCDVKAFLALILAAVAQTNPARFAPGLRVVLTADEEIGCIGASHLVTQDAIRPRRMIIGEPTSLHPARAGKGYCLAEVTVYGKEAHSAHPAQGRSAICDAARLITAIEALAESIAVEQNSFFQPPFTTLNIGAIHGGTAKNIVPGLCRFPLEWRPIPGQDAAAVFHSVTEIVTEMTAAHSGFLAEIQPLRQQHGFETPPDSPLVRRIESLAGRPAVSIPFGSEASLFAPLVDEVIVFGPGDMRTAHSSRECVPLAELDEAVALLHGLMESG
ncbi:MAG: acetylornithine deacetylase [Acidobacteriaceae bacterium]